MALGPTLQSIYQARIDAGALHPDPAQAEAVVLLQKLAERLNGYQPARGNFLTRLLAKAITAPRGLYLYGDVGRGKSMLMELFYEQVNVARKRRVHFHQFMLEVHERLYLIQREENVAGNIIPRLARELADEVWLLCFDEFHISNIADAMILGRLFEGLFAHGVVIFATSNWPPDELYKGGLQRERFLPFIALIKQRMQVHRLAGSVDHRYEYLRGLQNYFTPLGIVATAKLATIFAELTDGAVPEALNLPVQGRTVAVPRAAKGVALFTFEELCSQPLGPADFLALATCFNTLLIDGVPQLQPEQRNEAIRLMTLIDALYEAKTQLFIAAAVPPEQIYASGDQAFSFQRTVSRLVEMQSEAYRRQAHLG